MNTFKYHILGALVFLGVIFSGLLAYAAWVSLTADVPSQNNGDTINKDIWNNIVTKLNQTIDNVNYLSVNSSIPVGAIMAFNGTTCPTGWTAADGSGDEKNTSGVNTTLDLRGEFIRGLDSGRGVDTGRILGDLQNQNLPNLDAAVFNNGTNSIFFKQRTIVSYTPTRFTTVSSDGVPTGNNNIGTEVIVGIGENRPRNVAVLYCVKN